VIFDALKALGLTQSATVADVKASFKALAFTLHPDLGGDPSNFAALADHYREALAWVEAQPCPRCVKGVIQELQSNFKVVARPCDLCNGTGKRG
jgi:DnaJ-class molecular chaperone